MNEDETIAGPSSSPIYDDRIKEEVENFDQEVKKQLIAEGQNGIPTSGPSEAQRAYIAHTAPHLLNGVHDSFPSVNDPPTSNGWQIGNGGNVSDRSPSNSAQPSRSPSEEARERSGSRSASSPALHESNKTRSHHSVPKRFRGPLPMLGDAEDIGPLPNLIPFGTNEDEILYNMVNYPLNRNGWRYVAAGPASNDLPQTVYKSLETGPYGVHWSWADRSAFTHLSQDASIAAASNGFRSLRANVPVREGSWYVEVQILQPDSRAQSVKDGNHVRLGWGRREAPLNAPVGSNGYSYGVRDTTGEKVFLSRTYPYGNGFQPGDVIGMWISLPTLRQADPNDPLDPARIERKRLPIRYKGRLYFESLELAIPKEMDILMDRSRRGEKMQTIYGAPINETLINVNTDLLSPPKPKDEIKRKGGGPPPGSAPVKSTISNLRQLPTLGAKSKIGFFVNGKPQGIAFQNLLDFRPLRRQRAAHQNRVLKTKANTTRGLDVDEDDEAITSTSTAATIMKSRENHYDDGALGYFPMISLYGNAKARIVTKLEEMRFPPPQDVQKALEDVDKQEGRIVSADYSALSDNRIPCRPLEERFEEFLAELWQYDLLDEAKAQIQARKRELEESSDEEDEDTDVVKQSTKKPRKRGYHRRPSNKPLTRDHTPVPDSNVASPSSSAHVMVKEEEDEEDEDGMGGLEDRTIIGVEEPPSYVDKSTPALSPDLPRNDTDMVWHATHQNAKEQSKETTQSMQVD